MQQEIVVSFTCMAFFLMIVRLCKLTYCVTMMKVIAISFSFLDCTIEERMFNYFLDVRYRHCIVQPEYG